MPSQQNRVVQVHTMMLSYLLISDFFPIVNLNASVSNLFPLFHVVLLLGTFFFFLLISSLTFFLLHFSFVQTFYRYFLTNIREAPLTSNFAPRTAKCMTNKFLNFEVFLRYITIWAQSTLRWADSGHIPCKHHTFVVYPVLAIYVLASYLLGTSS